MVPSEIAGLPKVVGSSDPPTFLIEEISGVTHWDIQVSAVNSNGEERPLSARRVRVDR